MSEQQKSLFQFSGKGFEFFKIWIVNTLLTILTLGIYSAWAKVRTKKYFYNNTKLLDGSMDYHATGTQILKGRIIAVILFAALSFLSTVSPILSAGITGLLFLAAPIFIRAGLRFNARNTSYRNIRFNFTGSVAGAYKTYFLYPLLPVAFFVGLSFVISKMGVTAENNGSAGLEAMPEGFALVLGFGLILALCTIPYIMYKQSQYHFSNIKLGEHPLKYSVNAKNYYGLCLKLLAYNLLFGVVIAAIISVGIFMGKGEAIVQQMQEGAGIIPAAIGIILYLGYIVFTNSLMTVMVNNLNLNKLDLINNKLYSEMKVLSFFGLSLKNLFLTLLTVGLYWPFAKVALEQYKANHIGLQYDETIEQIKNAELTDESAIGEEISDIFDFDVAIA